MFTKKLNNYLLHSWDRPTGLIACNTMTPGAIQFEYDFLQRILMMQFNIFIDVWPIWIN